MPRYLGADTPESGRLADWSAVCTREASALSCVLMHPETRYAKSGDVSIAYQVVGDGPLDLVVVPGWISNVDFAGRTHSTASGCGGSRRSAA